MPRHIIHHPRYLGENLKRLRRSREITVERLAERVNVSKGYISMVESGKRSPHWTVLMRSVHALQQTLCRFFSEAESIPPPEDGIRSRRESRIVIDGDPLDERGNLPAGSSGGYTHILTPWHPAITAEVVEIYLPPHTEWTPEPIAFEGAVSGWVVEGRLLLVQRGTEYVMQPRETFSYDGATPHLLRNYTDGGTRAILMIAPVAF